MNFHLTLMRHKINMKKICTILIVTLMAFLLSSSGCTDVAYDIGDGYAYLCLGSKQHSLTKQYEGEQFPRILISSHVDDCYYDNTYILGKHIKPDINPSYIYKPELELFWNYSSEDSISYFIIHKKSITIYGPLNKCQYEAKIEELQINYENMKTPPGVTNYRKPKLFSFWSKK